MKIGYARVSTLEQNLDLQLRALEKGFWCKLERLGFRR
jgi:DNA invertase Pin-like site-specific DNA recombinase